MHIAFAVAQIGTHPILGNILFISAGLIAVVCIVCVVCANLLGTKEQEARDYLEGKIFINRYDGFGDMWTVYSFSDNKVSIETWDKSNSAPVGDLSEYTEYDVSVSLMNEYVDLTLGGSNLQLKWNERGYLSEPMYDRFFAYEPGEIDISMERNDFFCEHEFDTKVIKEATCTEAGEEIRTCKICGNCETIFPASKHSFENHECSVCGELEKSDMTADIWYTHKGVGVLQFQNCLIETATVSGNAVVTSYYMVCSHCHGIDGWLQLSAPELGYEASKLHTCDECGKTTVVKLRVKG